MLVAVLALVLSGAAQALISPPWSWVFLHPVAFAPALWIFSRTSGRRAFAAGWLMGTAANLSIFHWLIVTLNEFGGIPVPLALPIWLLYGLATGLYTAVFAWGVAPIRRVSGRLWPFAVAAWFCAAEFLNPQLFTYYQGVAWYEIPQLFLLTAVTGVAGVSFLVIACNAVVVQGVERLLGDSRESPRAWVRNAAVWVGLVLAAVGVSTHRLAAIERAEAEAPVLKVALVQPNYTIERRVKLLAEGIDAYARDLVDLSREVAAQASGLGGIDVFVWPEGSLAGAPDAEGNELVLAFARETGSEVWTGATHYAWVEADAVYAPFNSAFRIRTDGGHDPRYDKNYLVPFGEYVPFESHVPALSAFLPQGSFRAGTEMNVYDAGPTQLAFLICYEAIVSPFVRRALTGGANLLVNVTIDSWYGDTSEQAQHLMLAAIQSAQYGVPLVRATTTGISAFVDARGIITAETGTFTRETLVRTVRPLRVGSLYARVGDVFAWSCVGVSVVALSVAYRTRRRGLAQP